MKIKGNNIFLMCPSPCLCPHVFQMSCLCPNLTLSVLLTKVGLCISILGYVQDSQLKSYGATKILETIAYDSILGAGTDSNIEMN